MISHLVYFVCLQKQHQHQWHEAYHQVNSPSHSDHKYTSSLWVSVQTSMENLILGKLLPYSPVQALCAQRKFFKQLNTVTPLSPQWVYSGQLLGCPNSMFCTVPVQITDFILVSLISWALTPSLATALHALLFWPTCKLPKSFSSACFFSLLPAKSSKWYPSHSLNEVLFFFFQSGEYSIVFKIFLTQISGYR